MSVGGHGVVQRVLRLEQEGFEYQPDLVMLSIAATDQQFLLQHLRKALILGIDPPPGYRELLQGIARKAGVNGRMPIEMIERRLRPHIPEIYDWVFHRFAEQCAQRGVRPLVIYRPAPVDFEGLEASGRSELVSIAQANGLKVIDVSSAFDSVADRDQLVLAKWDQHTNALGHRLLANKLYDGLVQLLFNSSPK